MRARLWLLLGAVALIALAAPAATLSLLTAAMPGGGGGAQGQAAARRGLLGLLPGGQSQPQSVVTAGEAKLVSYRDEGELTQGPLFYATAEQGQTYDGGRPGRLPTGPWAPGDSYTRALVVRNTGSLDLWLTGVGVALRPGSSRALADAIQLRVTADPAGQDLLAGGSLGQFTGGVLPLSRQLPLPAGGAGATLYFAAGLPRQVGNAYQGLGLVADVSVRARQGRPCAITSLAAQESFLVGASTTPAGNGLVSGDLFVDGDLSTAGNGRVTGTGAATGSVSGNVATPRPHQQPVTLPAADWDALAAQARRSPNVYVSGDLHLRGSYSFAQPTLYYVSGDLTMDGNDTATISGQVTFVAAGQVSIAGSAVLQPADGSSSVALWSKGDASIAGSARVHALVYTPGALSVTGNGSLTGLAVTGQLSVAGNGALTAQAGPYPCPGDADD